MRKFFVIAFIFIVGCSLFAQQRTQIPYSIYGLGKIEPKGFARSFGMGRTGIALASPRYLNCLNPASTNNIDSISFFFDFGLGLDAVKYKDNRNDAQKGTDVNLKNLAIGFRINSHWTSSIGIAPFSTVGYKVVTTNPIAGSPQEFVTTQITGNGGLNQFYWQNAYQLFKKLTLGASFNYLFGSVESTEKISSDVFSYDQYIKQVSYYHKVYVDFGFQYLQSINDDYKIIVGGIFGNSHKIFIKNRMTIYDSKGTLSDDETLSRDKFSFPMYIGGGISMNYRDKFYLTFDYIYNDWTSTSVKNQHYSYESNNIYRLGAELIPGNYSVLGYFGSIAYRAGLYYEQSYLKIDDQRFADRGVSVGLGLPFLQSRTTINLSYNFGVNGTYENNLIREQYHSFLFSIAMHDWWFIKRKFD